MKIEIILCCILSIFFLVSAIIIIKGRGDWMIKNYRRLPEERRAQVNIFRLRIVMAGMLTSMAIMFPLNIFVRTDRQHAIMAIVTGVVLLLFTIAARLWANCPLTYIPRKKQ